MPASEQVPLFDPLAEGERVLHVLESMPPGLVMDQLMAAAVTSASDLLLACQAANCPVLASERQRYDIVCVLAMAKGVPCRDGRCGRFNHSILCYS